MEKKLQFAIKMFFDPWIRDMILNVLYGVGKFFGKESFTYFVISSTEVYDIYLLWNSEFANIDRFS